MQDLIDEKEFSKRTKIKVRTLQDWRSRRTGPALPFVKIGKLVRYRPEDGDALIASGLRVSGGAK